MVGNGTISYDHDRDGRPTELGGCNAMVRNLKHDSFIFIRYFRRRLTVRDQTQTLQTLLFFLCLAMCVYFIV